MNDPDVRVTVRDLDRWSKELEQLWRRRASVERAAEEAERELRKLERQLRDLERAVRRA